MEPILNNKYVSISPNPVLPMSDMDDVSKRQMTAKRRFLRRILNISKREIIENATIRSKVGIKVATEFIQRQVELFGHINTIVFK
uniref:Uncharacterized protein n=1 Tax=Arion vulgaris TaxID=1028688 RepID=A0A0B7BJ71_9EUPU